MALSQQQRRFFSFLTGHTVSNVVSEAEILAATKWFPSTFRTYRSKHYIDPFLANIGPGQYRILRDGKSLSINDLIHAFSQTRPPVLIPTPGLCLHGNGHNYTLAEHIGTGAVAQVWRATSESGGKYAVKIMMPREDLLDPKVFENVRRRFRREARHGMKLQNDNIISYRDEGTINRQPFLVMDCAEGSLASILTHGPMDFPDSLKIIEDCLSGLTYLHAHDCIHRDIKPPNILFFGSRSVLGDLGIVQWSDMNAAFTSAATITRSTIQLGSWYYMSPEQRRSPRDVTAQSDVYSLGVTWYEILTNTTPDPAAAGAGQVTAPTGIERADQLILRMLAYAPEDRPTISGIAQVLGGLRTTTARIKNG